MVTEILKKQAERAHSRNEDADAQARFDRGVLACQMLDDIIMRDKDLSGDEKNSLIGWLLADGKTGEGRLEDMRFRVGTDKALHQVNVWGDLLHAVRGLSDIDLDLVVRDVPKHRVRLTVWLEVEPSRAETALAIENFMPTEYEQSPADDWVAEVVAMRRLDGVDGVYTSEIAETERCRP